MEKFFRNLYYLFLVLLITSVTYLAVMLYIAPRQDALKRGFIPCTEKLVTDISACERGSIGCSLKFLWQDLRCNTKVITDGFAAWVEGEQKTPWENYLFEPKSPAEIDEEIPYEGSVAHDAEEMKNQIEFIKQKQAELEAAKARNLHLNENVIMSDPEEEIPAADKKEADKKVNSDEEKPGDISEEVFEEALSDESVEDTNPQNNKE